MPIESSDAKSSWVVGRGDDCDLIVREPAVSWHHCRLIRDGNEFTIEDLGSRSGVYIDGHLLASSGPVPVQYGANITLGSRVRMPWPAIPGTMRRTVVADRPPRAGAEVITIGRNPESDVHIDLPTISWNHAIIRGENGQYVIEDLNSVNHTFVGGLSNRIERAVLNPSQDVFLGSYKIPASRLLARDGKFKTGETARRKLPFPPDKGSMEIGRDPASDIPINQPMVSWRHARLTRTSEGILIEDLNSRNGTFVDGVRLHGRKLIKQGQEIGLGSYRLQLDIDGGLVERQYFGDVTIEAKDIVVCDAKGKTRLLNPMSFTIFPSELVAVMGPAGSGKTTLLKALNGYTRPVEGTVLFNGADLYRYYDRFRQQMGYVPQDDIMHPQLTVREAIHFSAKLRTDLTDSEIDSRMEKILKDLDIADRADKIIGSPERKVLSGGQRKRVNIALELITDTPVLFLDEPTSGLSSYDADAVIDLLKGLARSGKTVITTIHQPSLKIYKQFDDLIMISRDALSESELKKLDGIQPPGAMVYFGPAYPDSIQFFNPSGLADPSEPSPELIFDGMNRVDKHGRTEFWRRRYQASRYKSEFVDSRAGQQPIEGGKTGEESARRQFGFKQWFALIRRNVIVKMRDRAQIGILLLQAPLVAALLYAVISRLDQGDTHLPLKLVTLHFLLAIAAIWFGCNNAARDIVGEWTVYRRERMVTLKLLPYVCSKLAVLLALCSFQCATMLGIVYFACGLRSSFLRDFLILLILSMIGVGLGLAISAASKTTESAIAWLPLVLLPMIALAGGMRPIFEMHRTGRLASILVPSRWALEANVLDEARKWPDIPRDVLVPRTGSRSASEPIQPPQPGLAAQDCPEDDASGFFPSCVASSGGASLSPASESEFLHPNGETVRKYRHRYRDSVAVLGLMLFLATGSVLAILWKRDSDPQ